MRKRLLLLLAVASLAAGAAADTASPAATASTTVIIGHNGYSPAAVSIAAGDTVVFSNGDTVAHTVDFKQPTGIQCSGALPLAIAAGQTGSCTFSSAGKFAFSDPANKGKGFRGSVTVAPPPPLSLTAKPKAVLFGGTTTLSGALVSQQAGQSVQIAAQVCGQSKPATLATVTSTTGGAFTYAAKPLKNTTYTAQLRNASSTTATVAVEPKLQLRKAARHRYTVRISASDSFAGKHASFQRYSARLKHWRGVKQVLLRASKSGAAPTVVTAASFRSSLAPKQRVRVVLAQTQVGACYRASHSNTIRS